MASGSESDEAGLAGDVIQEELAKGVLYFDDFEQVMQHSRRLGIYRQFFDAQDPEMQPGSMAVSRSKGDPA
ncbi:MAG: hypothetical protein K0Q59_4371 [Paenibacillus sp.]|nr:hypothetical protein [Paenibacillus sp.]